MSDISQVTGIQYNQRDIIQSVINGTFFADYGIVKEVNADKTITVTHAVLSVLINGIPLPQTETHYVEVLYPASANYGNKWPLQIGDGVLLIGLKNYVDSTNGIESPTIPPRQFPHYTQNTMKAIPLQSVDSPKVSINVTDAGNLEIQNNNTGGLIQVKNSTKSLATILTNLATHLRDMTTINCVAGAPVTLSPASIALVAQDILDISLLLES